MKQSKTKGSKKHGRNKRPVCQVTSKFVRGTITFEQYRKLKA